MRILVCGDRRWRDVEFGRRVLDDFHAHHRVTEVVEGCAAGADRMAEEWAFDHGITLHHFPAAWERYGKSAGPIRNRQMLHMDPAYVLAFHRSFNTSKGTKDMVLIARAAGIPTEVFPNSHWSL